MISQIKIQGFRRLADVTLPLRSLNIVIGANGSGKTSLLDAFVWLAASAEGKLGEAVNASGGVNENLSAAIGPRGSRVPEIRFGLSHLTDRLDIAQYELALETDGISYRIAEERLDSDESIESTPGSSFRETRLSRQEFSSRLSQEIKRSLSPLVRYHALAVDRRAPVRLPQQIQQATMPGENGEDLIACLYTMRESSPSSFEVVEDTLRAAFPEFDRLSFPPVASGMLTMTWREKFSRRAFYPHQLSEGMLRFLWLVALLYSSGLPSVTLIDEPEVSLHPELLALLATCLRDASKRTQLIVATHSERLIRHLEPEDVVVLDSENGITTATRLNRENLASWMKEYTLDQLWEQGVLGGRP